MLQSEGRKEGRNSGGEGRKKKFNTTEQRDELCYCKQERRICYDVIQRREGGELLSWKETDE